MAPSTPLRRSGRTPRKPVSFVPGDSGDFHGGVPQGLLTSPDAKLRGPPGRTPHPSRRRPAATDADDDDDADDDGADTASAASSASSTSTPPTVSSAGVWMLGGCMMCFAVGSSLSMKRMTTAMPNYIAFLSLLHPIVLGLLFAAVALWRRVTGAVTDEMMRFPKFKFAVMGLWDSLACVLMMFGGKPPPAHTHTHPHPPCAPTVHVIFTHTLYTHYTHPIHTLAPVFTPSILTLCRCEDARSSAATAEPGVHAPDHGGVGGPPEEAVPPHAVGWSRRYHVRGLRRYGSAPD